MLVILFRLFGLFLQRLLFGFQSFDYEDTRRRLFQKCVFHNKFDIYVSIEIHFNIIKMKFTPTSI